MTAERDVQVYFLFDRMKPWPPVPSEGLAATPLGDDGYRLTETPFFVPNVAAGDVVDAQPDDSGVLWAGRRVSWGGRQTLRVNPRDGTTCAEVLAAFGALGLIGEELEEYAFVAFDVPPGVALQPVKDLLVEGMRAGRWWYEEACVGPDWPSDAPGGGG